MINKVNEAVIAIDEVISKLKLIETQVQYSEISDIYQSLTKIQQKVVAEDKYNQDKIHLNKELKTIFIEEAEEILDACNLALNNICEKNYLQSLSLLQRELHSLKGNLILVKQQHLAAIISALDNVFNIAKANFEVINDEFIDVVEYGLNTLAFGIDNLRNNKATLVYNDVISDIWRWVGNNQQYSTDAASKLYTSSSSENKLDIIKVSSDIYEKINFGVNDIGITLTNMKKIIEEINRDNINIINIFKDIMKVIDDNNLNFQKGCETLECNVITAMKIIEYQQYTMDSFDNSWFGQKTRYNQIHNELKNLDLMRFSAIVPRLEKLVARTAKIIGKKANLQVIGDDVKIDRKLLKVANFCFEQLIRNAIDHGIETSEERKTVGKSEKGNIVIVIRLRKDGVEVKLKDDGAGINLKELEKVAIKNKIKFDEKRIEDLIFYPGVTTKKHNDIVSGQGIGLDEVYDIINRNGGEITVETMEKRATVFTINLPFHKSTNSVLLISSGGYDFAIKINNVMGVDTCYVYYGDGETIEYHNEKYPVCTFNKLLKDKDDVNVNFGERCKLVFIKNSYGKIGLIVDNIIGAREILVNSLSSKLKSLCHISSSTMFDNGKLAYIINVNSVMNSLLKSEIDDEN